MVVLLIIGGIGLNPSPNQVSVTYIQVNLSMMHSPWFQLLVLVVLLIIGGIELNPSPNQVSVTYIQVNLSMMHSPIIPAASGGSVLIHRRDCIESRTKTGDYHIHTV